MQERVELFGRQVCEPAVAAARVVDDEDVERPERLPRRRDDARGCVRVREVRLDVRLQVRIRIVRAPAVREDLRAGLLQPARDREADARAARDAGDERASQVVRTETTSRTASEEAFSSCCSFSSRSSSTICSMPAAPSFTGTPM